MCLVETKGEIGEMLPQAKECWRLSHTLTCQEATGKHREIPEGVGHVDILFWTLDLPDGEKPLGMW